VALRVQTYALELDPIAQAYATRLLQLPTLRSWYEEGLREPWRDPAHDEEIAQYGQITQDLRAPHGAPPAP
jgi:glutathione S-transferase